MSYQPRLKTKYEEELKDKLAKELKIENKMALPKLTKIVINSGLGEAKNDSKIIDDMQEELANITGQLPVKTKAKKAISNFKISAGAEIGLKVTLRGDQMWEFLDKLVNIVLPRVKDFRGVPLNAFDGNGNYALGLKDHTIFPEIDTNKVTRARGMQIIFVTEDANNDQARELLKELGMPFEKK